MEPFKYASIITTVSVFTALFSIIYQAYIASNELKRVTDVLSNLMFLENNVTGSSVEGPKVAVGYGSCSDLFVRATGFLNFTEEFENDLDVDEINSERELLISFAYYFQRGVAAERYIPNKDLFKSLVQKAKELRQADAHWNLGGAASLMAMRFAKEGANVLLGASMSTDLYKRLNSDKIKLSNQQFLDEDDIHLILEYQNGEKWGKTTAPRANRYILHNDNLHQNIFEDFHIALPQFDPDLVIISGLQIMDSHPLFSESRESHLKEIQMQLRKLQRSSRIHFEMASYTEPIYLNKILDLIFPYVDSLGMNEQELETVLSILEHGIISPPTDINPPVAKTLDNMRSVFIYFHDRHRKNQSRGRQITRLHLHTLAYQTIMTVKSSKWQNTKQSAAKASIRASKHVCGTEILNPGSFSLFLDKEFSSSQNSPIKRIILKDNDVVPCWTEILRTGYESVEVEFCVAPNLVCTRAFQTAGAGDHISAAGLILQI